MKLESKAKSIEYIIEKCDYNDKRLMCFLDDALEALREERDNHRKELQKVVSARIEELEKNHAVKVQTHYRNLWLKTKDNG